VGGATTNTRHDVVTRLPGGVLPPPAGARSCALPPLPNCVYLRELGRWRIRNDLLLQLFRLARVCPEGCADADGGGVCVWRASVEVCG
jgi:hypothetical protein